MSAESVTATTGEPISVQHGSLTITSTHGTEDTIREDAGIPSKDEETSEAAAKLAKKGAEARKAKPKAEKPPKVEEETPEPKETKPAAAKDETATSDEKKRGDPKSNPIARVEKLEGQIASLAAERREEARLLREIRAERERLAQPAKKEPAQATQAAKAAPEDKEPDYNDAAKYPDGRFDPKYFNDMLDYKLEKRLRAEREQDAKERAEQEVQSRIQRRTDAYAKRADSAFEDEDFRSRLQAIPAESDGGRILKALLSAEPWEVVPQDQRGPTNLIVDWLLDSEQAPQIQLYLAENPKEFQALVSLGPNDLLRALTRLEVRLEQPSKSDSRPLPVTAGAGEPDYSRAKPPLRPVRATAPAEPEDDSDDSRPLSDFVRRFGQREAARAR